MRLYTTQAAYKLINEPLRNIERTTSHPLATTVMFIVHGLLKLRKLEAPDYTQPPPPRLWRGMRNVRAPDDLMTKGGTELAHLSFSSDLNLAANFASSRTSLIFMVNSDVSWMQRGISIEWLSTVPSEREYLWPPCTYMKPTGRIKRLELAGGQTCTIVEVGPDWGGAD